MRLAFENAILHPPEDIWSIGAGGEWIWLNGIITSLGGNTEEITILRKAKQLLAESEPDCVTSASSLGTDSGENIRFEINRLL